MISAGNDIVALNAIDKRRTNLPAFYSKFITPSELTLYNESDISFQNFVWLLWSVKESVYKYLKRGDGDLVFSPSRIKIQQIDVADGFSNCPLQTDESIDLLYSGQTLFSSDQLYFQSSINKNFIATVVNDDAGFEQIYWVVKLIDKPDHASQSKAVRLFVLDKLNSLIIEDDLWINKHPIGYPILLHNNQQIDIPISFAHHDRYVSYSFQIPK
ncbi:MAG: 4-phosphopantetheinyl transferase superfamily protein [Mucilaginibacter sp.]|uniref:4'-phosphopantetheinyl transferase family protein n=1 Tax=Mucilaginibacter sp. TaxID=1882438 RepID=UPI00260451C5|nr:4'-phosphopantetheinyl transferase superfamily protein [Mucilaginibacter sp.]MDB5004268.1 4-phosphopantetheinyl transferase superfamily protein [Mucilaginibacter sp.]